MHSPSILVDSRIKVGSCGGATHEVILTEAEVNWIKNNAAKTIPQNHLLDEDKVFKSDQEDKVSNQKDKIIN